MKNRKDRFIQRDYTEIDRQAESKWVPGQQEMGMA